MSGRLLVDTNVVIALFAGDPAAVERLDDKPALFLCVPVLGELRYGALASSRVEQNLARLDEFSKAVEVLPCDSETAVLYSAVKFDLRRKGRPIPENDVWIAAIARQHRLTLVSRDSHFQQIEGLELELLSKRHRGNGDFA
jgi:tRNA(fMet)-specific endonuclease VapC